MAPYEIPKVVMGMLFALWLSGWPQHTLIMTAMSWKVVNYLGDWQLDRIILTERARGKMKSTVAFCNPKRANERPENVEPRKAPVVYEMAKIHAMWPNATFVRTYPSSLECMQINSRFFYLVVLNSQNGVNKWCKHGNENRRKANTKSDNPHVAWLEISESSENIE
jgi:hypothetical protein